MEQREGEGLKMDTRTIIVTNNLHGDRTRVHHILLSSWPSDAYHNPGGLNVPGIIGSQAVDPSSFPISRSGNQRDSLPKPLQRNTRRLI